MASTARRLEKLIDKLETILDEWYYIDGDAEDGDTKTDLTKQEVYNIVMEDEEIHFLGKSTIMTWVNMFYDDWNSYERTRLALVRNGVI